MLEEGLMLGEGPDAGVGTSDAGQGLMLGEVLMLD